MPSDDEPSDRTPATLSRLMDFDRRPEPFWSPAELADILRHQLQAGLLVDLTQVEGAREGEIESLCAAASPAVRSFEDLLHHPTPPPALLELTKRFAKANAAARERLLPPEVTTTIYFASIAAARLRCGLRITALQDGPLRERLRDLIPRPWLDARTRSLLVEAADALARPIEVE